MIGRKGMVLTLSLATMGALVSGVVVGMHVLGAEPTERGGPTGVRKGGGAAPAADHAKERIEVGVKGAVAHTAAVPASPAVRPDAGKRDIETPTAQLLKARTANRTADNPKVEPGKVRWHGNFADACAAAKKSGKPVLLFHLMGNLDDQFC